MKNRITVVTTLALLLLSANAWALYQADLTYNYLRSGNHYTFNVSATNTSTDQDSAPLDLFKINLDADSNLSNYKNIAWISYNNPSWVSDLAQYSSGFGGAEVSGNVVAFTANFGEGIGQGSNLKGISFSFDYTGNLAPEDQLFSWYATFGSNSISGLPVGNDPTNPDYYITADSSGFLVYEGGTPPTVPEPSTMMLVGAGLISVIVFRRKRNTQ